MTATKTKERPILFSGPMVRAILEGRKSQTRRVAKFKPLHEGLNLTFSGLEADDQGVCGWALASRDGRGTWNERTKLLRCPYGQPGDRLWVREAAQLRAVGTNRTGGPEWFDLKYKADESMNGELREFRRPSCKPYTAARWTPGIHMPRWACRIELEITRVRVELLNRMSFNDWKADFCPSLNEQSRALETFVGSDNQRKMAAEFWDGINAKRGYPWASNPWVWVIEFSSKMHSTREEK